VTAALAQVPWQTLVASGVVAALIGIVGLMLRAIVRGDLVPRKHLEDAQAERDKWEGAWRLQQAALSEFDGRLDANTEALRLVEQLVSALATKGSAR
jgi:hypothetical protein